MYTRTILEGSGYQFIKNSYSSKSGAPGIGRQKKRKRTPEDMERQNRSNRARHVQLLILGNFKEGWHITLTYAKDKRPQTPEEAKRNLQKFHRRMKTKFKKAGFEYKWLAVTEIGSKGAVHHHLILEDIHTEDFTTQKAVSECWAYQTYFSMLYEEGSYEYDLIQQYIRYYNDSVAGIGAMYNTTDETVKAKYAAQGGVPFLDGGYVVFGQTVEGFDVIDKISAVEVASNASGEASSPVKEITIEKVVIRIVD